MVLQPCVYYSLLRQVYGSIMNLIGPRIHESCIHRLSRLILQRCSTGRSEPP